MVLVVAYSLQSAKVDMKPAALMPKVNKPSGTDGKPAMRNVQNIQRS